MKFMPYQWDWIKDKSRRRIFVKSRRIGGSYAASYDAFRTILDRPNHDVNVVTQSLKTAQLFIDYVGLWVKVWNMTNSPSMQIPDSCVQRSSITIPHQCGASRLITVSSNPNAIAGHGGDLIIDEMALHDNQDLLMRVATPVVAAGGQISLISTHRSKSSLFNQYVINAEKPDSGWTVHKTTIVQALEMGFLDQVVNPTRLKGGLEPTTIKKYISELKDKDCMGDEAMWDQEFMCIPSEKQYTLIQWDLIVAAARDFTKTERGPCYLGWDLAESEHGDYSVMFVVQRVGDELIVKDYEYMKGIELPDQREKLHYLVKKHNVSKMAVDATGLGTDNAHILERYYGKSRVVGYNMHRQSKEELASKMLGIFQEHKIYIPGDQQIMKDINNVEKFYTEAGNVTYHAPRIGGSHGDGFWALGLAVIAAGWERTGIIEIIDPKSDKAVLEKEGWTNASAWIQIEDSKLQKGSQWDCL